MFESAEDLSPVSEAVTFLASRYFLKDDGTEEKIDLKRYQRRKTPVNKSKSDIKIVVIIPQTLRLTEQPLLLFQRFLFQEN